MRYSDVAQEARLHFELRVPHPARRATSVGPVIALQ